MILTSRILFVHPTKSMFPHLGILVRVIQDLVDSINAYAFLHVIRKSSKEDNHVLSSSSGAMV